MGGVNCSTYWLLCDLLAYLGRMAYDVLIFTAALVVFVRVLPTALRAFLWLCMRFDWYNSDYAARMVRSLQRTCSLAKAPRLKLKHLQRVRPTTTTTRDRIIHAVFFCGFFEPLPSLSLLSWSCAHNCSANLHAAQPHTAPSPGIKYAQSILFVKQKQNNQSIPFTAIILGSTQGEEES
jgi:hypothetical protein